MNEQLYNLVYTALQADNEADYTAVIQETEQLNTREQIEFWAALHSLALETLTVTEGIASLEAKPWRR